jgi:type IV pilus assembly protein PilQ
MWLSLAVATFLAVPVAPASERDSQETRISVDLKDVAIVDLVRLLAEVGAFQTVIDPGVSCSLTLKLKDVPWPNVLDVALRSCRLGSDEDNGIVRVASVTRLAEEAAERRRLDEERRQSGPLRTTRYRLSYARAQELAPLIKRFLSPRGDVVFDGRTNTLIVTDID